jgi:hypothetical protein
MQNQEQAAPQPEDDLTCQADRPSETDVAAQSAIRRQEMQRRLDRVTAYGNASLSKRNHSLATLGSINSGLMRVNLYVEEALVQALATGPLTIEQVHKVQPSIDLLLRVTRQIDRLSQLEIKSKPRRSLPPDGAPGESHLKHGGVGG